MCSLKVPLLRSLDIDTNTHTHTNTRARATWFTSKQGLAVFDLRSDSMNTYAIELLSIYIERANWNGIGIRIVWTYFFGLIVIYKEKRTRKKKERKKNYDVQIVNYMYIDDSLNLNPYYAKTTTKWNKWYTGSILRLRLCWKVSRNTNRERLHLTDSL